jgi:hypothetical protein
MALLIGGSLAVIAAIAGTSLAIAKSVRKDSSSVSASSSINQSKDDSSSSPTTSSSSSSGTTTSNTSSSKQEAVDSPYITCDVTSLDYQMANSDTEFPVNSFTASINNVPSSATDYAKTHLSICSTDTTFTDYLEFYLVRDGKEVSCGNAAIIIYSGEKVYARQKKKAPIAGGYSLRLRVASPYYDISLVKWFIDVKMTTTQ